MGDKNIRKEVKKMKKSDKKSTVPLASYTPTATVVQPELIKKERKKK